MAYLYRHIRLDKNEPFYIGVGGLNKFDNYKRAYSINRNNLWNKIVKKTDFIVQIVLDNIDSYFIFDKEIEFIKIYGRIDNGTGILANLNDGGKGLLNPSKECRDKISKANLNNTNRLNHINSKEHNSKIAASQTGKVIPQKVKDKISNVKKGKYFGSNDYKKINIKRISVIDETDVKFYNSLNDAHKDGFNKSPISLILNNIRTTPYKGYFWEKIK